MMRSVNSIKPSDGNTTVMCRMLLIKLMQTMVSFKGPPRDVFRVIGSMVPSLFTDTIRRVNSEIEVACQSRKDTFGVPDMGPDEMNLLETLLGIRSTHINGQYTQIATRTR